MSTVFVIYLSNSLIDVKEREKGERKESEIVWIIKRLLFIVCFQFCTRNESGLTFCELRVTKIIICREYDERV